MRLRKYSEAASSATERYRVGKGAQADVLRANLEVTSAEEKLVALRGERRRVAARWNALQVLPAFADVAPVALPRAEPPVPAADALTREAATRSPLLEAAAAAVRASEEGRDLAGTERRPETSLFGFYGHRVSYDDMGGIGVSLSLPFFQPRRLREKEAEAEAQVSEARANLQAAKNRIEQGIAEAAADLDRSLEQARLYRSTILPQAEVNARAAEQAYVVGQVDFLTYVRARLDRDAYEAEFAMRRADAWRAVAALQKASGLPLVPGTPTPEGHDHD